MIPTCPHGAILNERHELCLLATLSFALCLRLLLARRRRRLRCLVEADALVRWRVGALTGAVTSDRGWAGRRELSRGCVSLLLPRPLIKVLGNLGEPIPGRCRRRATSCAQWGDGRRIN